jgi:hypothetical protein
MRKSETNWEFLSPQTVNKLIFSFFFILTIFSKCWKALRPELDFTARGLLTARKVQEYKMTLVYLRK